MSLDGRVIEAKKALTRFEDRNSKPNPAHLADAVRGLLALVDELTEVPEPSGKCAQPCVHLSQEDAREGRTCAEHPCTCREPQGETLGARGEAG
ncbi:hypothetical protein GCM10009651_35900 [Microbacterium natoriense]|uniref:hypothetical protein n=1 Tax=Microbacterium natoriense TaxID=284570 RepID=UPI0031DE6174